jgi:hypothetical protein
MRNIALFVFRGLGNMLAWFVQGVFQILGTLITEMVRGVFGLLRPIIPWAVVAVVVLGTFQFAPEVFEAIVTLGIVGLGLKVIVSSTTKKGDKKKN